MNFVLKTVTFISNLDASVLYVGHQLVHLLTGIHGCH